MDREEVFSTPVSTAGTRATAAVATAVLVLSMGWSAVVMAQSPRGLWPAAFFHQLQPQHADEPPRAGELQDNPLDRLDESQLEALVAQLRPGSAEARALADRLAIRASNALAERNWFQAETDILWILHLAPDHPEGLSFLARLEAEAELVAPTDWPSDGHVVTPPERGARSLVHHQQHDLPGLQFVARTGFPRSAVLLLVWGVFWLLLVAGGSRARRDVNGSRIRLWVVTAIVAVIALLPLALPVLWGVFHEPGEHTWTVVFLGTFLNLVVCNQYLQPPIQLVGQKSLPLVEDPAILSRLAKLAAAIGVPAPPLRLWPSISDNQPTLAFAGTVSAPQLVITDGALNRLADEESDAILAHELAHLANHSLWFHLPTLSAAAILAGQVSGAGGFPAAGLGWLCLVGIQRLVSRPLEFDSDRRAALVVTPQSMMRALEKIHLVHRIEGNEWLKRLCYVMATHPSPSSRIARLKQQACVELSRAESSELSRGRWLGWMVFGAWLGAIVGGLALIRSWRVAAIPVGVMWIALSLLPQHLERLATRKIRRLNARRMASRKIHWSTWLFWSLWFASLGGLVLPQFLSSDHSDFSWISISALCLQVVLAGILLMRMTRRSRLQHNILTASTLGNHEDVVREFDNAPRWFQRDPTMDNLAAVALALTGRRTEAIHRLEQLHAREPRFPAALMTLIALDYEEGNDTRAEALAARLTGLLPADPIGPFRQILSLVRMGRLDEARTVLESARGRIPTAELLDLAEAALAIHGIQPERARELLETCDSRLPGDCLVATLWVEWYLRQVPAADTATKTHAAFERLETLVQSNRLVMLDKTVERLRQQMPVDNGHPNEASQPEVEWTSET